MADLKEKFKHVKPWQLAVGGGVIIAVIGYYLKTRNGGTSGLVTLTPNAPASGDATGSGSTGGTGTTVNVGGGDTGSGSGTIGGSDGGAGGGLDTGSGDGSSGGSGLPPLYLNGGVNNGLPWPFGGTPAPGAGWMPNGAGGYEPIPNLAATQTLQNNNPPLPGTGLNTSPTFGGSAAQGYQPLEYQNSPIVQGAYNPGNVLAALGASQVPGSALLNLTPAENTAFYNTPPTSSQPVERIGAGGVPYYVLPR